MPLRRIKRIKRDKATMDELENNMFETDEQRNYRMQRQMKEDKLKAERKKQNDCH